MYGSGSGHRSPRRSRRTQSDPGHPHVLPPYTVRWPAPARRTTEPQGMIAGMPYPQSPQSPSRSSSVERIGDPSVSRAGSLLAQHHVPSSPNGTSPPTPVSPRSRSPQRSGHQGSSSRQGSIRAPQGSGPFIKDAPQPTRSALNVSSAIMPVAPHPHPATWGQGRGQGVPVASQSPSTTTSTPFQSAGTQRQGSHHTVYQQPPASVYQNTSPTHLSHHHSTLHHPSTPHHTLHHRSRSRSRSRVPSAASHRYASGSTQPVYGHGSSATLNGSRTSLNGGVPSQKNHHAISPPPGISTSYHPGTGPTHMPSGSPQRSWSQTRVPPSGTHGTTGTLHSAHKLKERPPSPPTPPLAASEIRHTTQLPANYDGQTQTRYVNMLLALDDISPLFNILASFFTWILLAGFLLFPGTFASWQDEPAGTPQSDILNVVNNVSL